MSLEGSVTKDLGKLKQGDHAAARALWERYFPSLVAMARRQFRSTTGGAADEEDVALGAFARFCESAEQGRLSAVRNRDEVRRLLFALTIRMSIDELRRECRQKRGGSGLAGLNDMPGAMLASDLPAELVISREPPPDLVVQVEEECERLLASLDDEDLRAIAVWKSEGCTNEEIAGKLGVVLRTVERKLRVIRQRWTANASPATRGECSGQP
jgi:DNA-directed RNA polymerase specialized sigma24 family protein